MNDLVIDNFIQNISILITAIIAIVSLIISVLNFWYKKPKLKIEITDKKWDCFFGKATTEANLKTKSSIAGAKINIINNSPVAINVNKMNMIVDNESLRLISINNPYWEIVYFSHDESEEVINNEFSIYYQVEGVELPRKIDAYDTLSVYVLFHDFPVWIKHKKKAKLVLSTAIGKIRKRITLVEYDKNYLYEEYREYLQHCRSLEEKN